VTRFAETIDQISKRSEAAIEPKQNERDGQPAEEARVT
jgi:hypothetical protein